MVGSGDDPDKQMNTYVSTMYVRVRNFGVVTSQNWTRIGGDKLEPAWINKHITTAAEVKEDFSFFAGLQYGLRVLTQRIDRALPKDSSVYGNL